MEVGEFCGFLCGTEQESSAALGNKIHTTNDIHLQHPGTKRICLQTSSQGATSWDYLIPRYTLL